MSKIAVVGKGTVGCLSVAFFLNRTDCEIDWYFDPTTPSLSVGEGTILNVPESLSQSLGWTSNDLLELKGTVKLGTYKKNWGNGGEFLHSFPLGNVGIHFNAIELQDKILQSVSANNRVNIIHKQIDNPYVIDADYVMVCSGKFNTSKAVNEIDDTYLPALSIPINSAFVTQCYWDNAKFNYTLTYARPYGWVFGIPLQNRCSLGYMYNRDITSIDDMKADLSLVIEEYDLTPSNETISLDFKNYKKKKNFDHKVAFNGTASFFFEPLEASSLACAEMVNGIALDVWSGNMSASQGNAEYEELMDATENMLAFHYIDNKSYSNDFWSHAKAISRKRIDEQLLSHTDFANNLKLALIDKQDKFFGTWGTRSWLLNFEKMGIQYAN